MGSKIRWGVIGSGGIAQRRTIPEGITKAKNGELKVVFDIDARVNTEVAGKFGAKEADAVEDLLSADIDAVYIATPASVHAEQVRACAKAGKHILCEKPLGMTVAEAEEMIDICKRAGVKLGCAFMMRFVAQHQEALMLIEEGKLGKPTYINEYSGYVSLPVIYRNSAASDGASVPETSISPGEMEIQITVQVVYSIK